MPNPDYLNPNEKVAAEYKRICGLLDKGGVELTPEGCMALVLILARLAVDLKMPRATFVEMLEHYYVRTQQINEQYKSCS